MKKNIVFLILIVASEMLMGQGRYDAMLKAVALSAAGRHEDAAGILTGVMAGRNDVDLLLLRGEMWLKSGKLKEASADFMSAENIRPGSGMYGLARCAAAGGDKRGAVAYLEAHLRSDYRKTEPEIMLDTSFSALAALPEWRNLWKKEWYKGYERKSWEIENYLKRGRADLAQEVLSELSVQYPEMPVTDYCKARLMMSKGKYREAAALLASLTANGNVPSSWYIALAEAYEGEGNHQAAASVYGSLISLEYPDLQILLKRARMLIKSGDRNAAKADLERYLGLDPDNTHALGLAGKILAEEGAIYDALPYLNANIEKHPGEALAFSLRADAWMAARTWDKAVEDYTMSLDLDPDNAGANLNLGIALINSGKTEDACHYLRKARSLGEKTATQYLSKYCIR